MSVFKRWNGSQWVTIGPGISSARFENINNMIAPEYDPQKTYNIGDYVVQSDKLYRCITNISVPQAWQLSQWIEVKLGPDVTDLRNNVVEVSETPPINENNRIWVRPDNNNMQIPLVEDVMLLPNENDYGSNGQYPRSTGNGIEWVDYGLPSDQQTENAINTWLTAHPEATTTVQDNSITLQKINDNTIGDIINHYYTPEKLQEINLVDIIENVPTGKVLYLDGNVQYNLDETLDLSDITIYGNGCTINILRHDEGFTFNNEHKHVIRIYNNVHLFNINFLFNYINSEQFPIYSGLYQRGICFLGSNTSVNMCTFKNTQSNTLLVYGENVHNLNINNCSLISCANGIQCETAANLTQPDYSVTFQNCYVNAYCSASGICSASFIGCTFEQRTGGTYPNFQAGINDANVTVGSITSCINCNFIGTSTNLNVITYGYNTVAVHKHRGFSSFIGCRFSCDKNNAYPVCGDTLFENCIFERGGIYPSYTSGMPQDKVTITLKNCHFLGVDDTNIQYLVQASNGIPANITLIGNTTRNNNLNNLRLISIGASNATNTHIALINNISGTCNVSELKTPVLWFNNRKYDGTGMQNASYANQAKYGWIQDINNKPEFTLAQLEDSEFINNVFGIYTFGDDRSIRFVGRGTNYKICNF